MIADVRRIPVCHICHSIDGVITGDGPDTCVTCVYHYGRMVFQPWEFATAELSRLEAEHEGTVQLVWSSAELMKRTGRPKAFWAWVADR